MGLSWLGENVGRWAQDANPPALWDLSGHPWSWATLQVPQASKAGEAHPTGGHRPPGQPTCDQPRGPSTGGWTPAPREEARSTPSTHLCMASEGGGSWRSVWMKATALGPM